MAIFFSIQKSSTSESHSTSGYSSDAVTQPSTGNNFYSKTGNVDSGSAMHATSTLEEPATTVTESITALESSLGGEEVMATTR